MISQEWCKCVTKAREAANTHQQRRDQRKHVELRSFCLSMQSQQAVTQSCSCERDAKSGIEQLLAREIVLFKNKKYDYNTHSESGR